MTPHRLPATVADTPTYLCAPVLANRCNRARGLGIVVDPRRRACDARGGDTSAAEEFTEADRKGVAPRSPQTHPDGVIVVVSGQGYKVDVQQSPDLLRDSREHLLRCRAASHQRRATRRSAACSWAISPLDRMAISASAPPPAAVAPKR